MTAGSGLVVVVTAGLLVVALASRSGPGRVVPVCRGQLALGAPLPSPPAAATGEEPPPRLQVSMGPTGEVREVRVGARRLPLLASPGGFSLRPAGGSPNLIPDPGFERDRDSDGVPDGWTFTPGTAGPPVLAGEGHSGRRSVRLDAPSRGSSGQVSSLVPVRPRTYYVLSVWFRSRDVRPSLPTAVREPWDPHSPLRVEVEQLRGGTVVGVARAYGYTGSAGWNRQFVGFLTAPGVRAVRIVGSLSTGSGTGWLDDLYLGTLFAGPEVRVAGSARRDSERVRFRGRMGPLALTATLRPDRDHVWVAGAVRGLDRRDHAFQLRFTLPVDAVGWWWDDFARASRRIATGSYGYLSTTSLQRTSRYPFGVIHDGQSALALGVPLSDPRIVRVTYDSSRGLSIAFDLGLSPRARLLGPRATFSFVIYTADPDWGFRAATQRYYDLFPDSFRRRTDPACEGAWFVAPPLDSLDATYRRFGLGLDMVALGKASSQSHATWGERYLPWDRTRHIGATAYTHQWAFFDPLPGATAPPYEEAIGSLERLTRSHSTDPEAARLAREARATLASAQRDYNGRLYYERWRGYLAFYENLDRLPGASTDWSRAALREQVQRALELAREAGGGLSGIHLDSTSGMRRWGAADDYDPAHWAAARVPLTFSYDSGLVVERGILAMDGQIQDVADLVHRRGMILTANFNAAEDRTLGFVGADRIDFFGLEQGLIDRGLTPGGLDRFALLKRTLAWQRPISTLDHRIGQGKLGPGEIDRRLQQNLFYGIFAGAFDAATEADARGGPVTWSTEANARLWARYTPILRELTRAGWYPITAARSSDPRVWVERFGAPVTGDLHFTLHNETGVARTTVLAVDLRRLRVAGPLVATEELTGVRVPLAFDPSGAMARLRLTIPAHSTRVLAFGAGS